jgi:signal transduction histidine kinase
MVGGPVDSQSEKMNSFRGGTYAGGHVPEDSAVQDEIAWDADRSLLDAIMPTLKAGIWEAANDSLRLISLNFGRTERPILTIAKDRLQEGVCWSDFVCPLDKERVKNFLGKASSAGGRKAVEYRIIVGNGELLWVRHHVLQRIQAPDGQIILRGLITAIHEQKHLEWECLRVSERECNRIGQELHDDLCQVLAGLSYMMQVLARRTAKVDPALGTEIDELNVHVSDAVKRTRSMAHGLFPAQLNYATLRHALKEFVRQMKDRFPVVITLDLPRNLPAHSPEQIIHLYRIAQEAVSNSVRHGNAKAIKIAATVQPNSIRFSVEDNGKGLPVLSARPEGIGMHVMCYRARILGGDIDFTNNPPNGAVVQLSYPIGVLRYPRKSAPTSS